ncbi:S-adenosyl-L-methionine-dependent methyltransferase [Suhomyces tanzawaensis NRRL Y-17324]|uniref:S-adenosyl-L-methionine-dependent methyltransferase n=1 Tax=Suhomyces tanzawaensis NRRL Y-17324 TaxID=984487 RepID=A0A1E4SRS0_9ASCO|nr:S-adenosyl-L-methionine-dependent methyltransferase [Suhomyces tanzawaensis NRRL Y-17324]ODV82194.1 S-adenosyl-L-methionine-dependent methyltransferase [Suhomyces tanzawaensis NRRL Y-17324]
MKLYFEAEQFLKPNGRTNGSLQSRIFNDKKLTNSPKHVFAVVYSTLKYKDYIVEVIRKSKIKLQMVKPKVSEELLMLLVHDLLFSPKGRIQLGKHPIKDAFLKHRTRLQAEFTKLKLRYKVKAASELPTEEADGDETPVRWFRINTIRCDNAAVASQPWFGALQRVSSIDEICQPGVIYHDEYIPHLYGVHPREKITSTQAYLDGQIIIQDRASCFPAHILNYTPHQHIIDACAAPGNKTTHNASYVAANGVVYAFERDPKRVKVLKLMCDKATGPQRKLIQITNADFTSTNPSDFDLVTGLTVDPSCSGSGIFGRALEEQDKEEIDTERLAKLAGFQFKIVKHALLFPGANRVVYSTCSIHPHENERVVVDLLSDLQVQAQGWKLDLRNRVLPKWPRRGWKEEFSAVAGGDEAKMEELAGGCVRAVPKEDGGIGFFAACFTREPRSTA